MVIGNGKNAEQVLKGLNDKDLTRTVKARQNHMFGGTNTCRSYLKYISAIAGVIPHTNEASGKAHSNMESMHHNLGPPHVFLTATMDDENSFVLQIFAGKFIDDESDVGKLSDDELKARAKLRTELRLSFPGLAAAAFEEVLDIIMEEVIS